MVMMLGYQQLFLFISVVCLPSFLFTSWTCTLPSFSPLSLFFPYFLLHPSFFVSTPFSSSFFPLFVSLLHKHLPSLWSRGWQDKKHVSIRQSRKGRIDSETKGGFTAPYECMCTDVHNMCISKYSYMLALLSKLYTQVFRLEETENGVKTWLIALPLNKAQIRAAKHCFNEKRWQKFIQTHSWESIFLKNIFSSLYCFSGVGVHFSWTNLKKKIL